MELISRTARERKLKPVIISVSLVSIIVPYFKTIYSLDVQQNSLYSGLEQMVLKAQFKPDETHWQRMGTDREKQNPVVSNYF